ncbi:hypothetical protein AYO08_10440 [Pseudomonas putida]|uniref:hypothetical protein n=1 Tax=Pseudomonas TaxID=286 RepID=UPI0007DC12C9|nr:MULTISPECIES: hypothetical protein [Pseudomonas]OAS07739.1 hypothetical protein AYO08_10440 [Pseudomonas putida]OOV92672.1 hypothetical protein MF6396_25445 [Pseudomonas sp. MF6396]QNV69434.1 hypothetical protein F7661_28385 [Pseudomonas sp. CFA]
MTITTDMLARIAVVVLAVIISIAIKRRKALFTVKNASGPEQVQAIQGFADRSLRDVNLLIWLCSALCAAALAVCFYSIFIPL